jgi:hypothetical protein
LIFVAFASTNACIGSERPDEASEPVAEVQQEFSSFGIERVIPLRIIQATNNCNTTPVIDPVFAGPPYNIAPNPNWSVCSTCSDGTNNCGPDTVSFETIRSAVEQANFALRALRIQIYVSRIEKYAMPTFYTTCNPSHICPYVHWGTVQSDLQKIYPYLNDPTTDAFAEISWISRAKLLAGDPTQVDVVVAHYSGGGEGRRPGEGPASLTCDAWLFDRPRALAHEIAHIVGVEHTMAPELQAVRDPVQLGDLGVAPLSEYWDLSYGKGPAPLYYPNTYFTTREQAQQFAADGGVLLPKTTWDTGHNCSVDVNCTVSCLIGTVLKDSVTTGDPAMAGLGFTFAGDQPGSGIYRRGFNTMLYMHNPYADGRPFCEWSSFSDSQAEQARKILRSDILLSAPWLGLSPSNGYSSKRFALGNVKTITGFEKLDFNGDGKRDIAIWEPPNTTGSPNAVFRARTSPNYTSELSRTFGLSGDVPVPADYDGDGKTDFAVIRRGGMAADDPYDSQLYWVWCSSAAGHNCGTNNNGYGSVQWGYQRDIPLPGLEFDGNANTKEVAVYRPTNGYVYWKVIGSSTWGSIETRFHFNSWFTPLHGLYDSDNKTDLVAYDPAGGRFYIARSSVNWNVSQQLVRYVNQALIPNAVAASDAGAGAPAVRFGGVPVVAEKNGRRVLRIWDAYTATWYTNWNPTTSSSFQACSMGSRGDVPLSGPIDSDLNGYTDLALYHPTGAWSPMIQVQRVSEASCNLGGALAYPGSNPRFIVSAVRDMDSVDGRGDFLVLDPDKSKWTRFISQSNGTFVAQPVIDFGQVGSLAL